ncbi:MAG: hypothetical protein JKY76_02415 [Proteobacteria bacterium]|nr:hypothetical protein [Pseudomonadota bacterium]
MTWTDAEIDKYIDSSFKLVETTQNKLEKEFNLGHFEQWSLNQEKAELTFSSSSKAQVTCKIFALGTYANGYWQWAWASSSLVDSFANKSKIMQKLGTVSGLNLFESAAFPADESMTWELAGMALKEIGGIGVYRCSSTSSDLFVIIESITSK